MQVYRSGLEMYPDGGDPSRADGRGPRGDGGARVTAAQILATAFAGWTALSVVVAAAMFPLLRSARRSDVLERHAVDAPRLQGPPPRDLRGSGYLGIVLERLVLHACTVFAADEVCVFA